MSNYDTCKFRLFDCLGNPQFDEDQAILNDHTMARGNEGHSRHFQVNISKEYFKSFYRTSYLQHLRHGISII